MVIVSLYSTNGTRGVPYMKGFDAFGCPPPKMSTDFPI